MNELVKLCDRPSVHLVTLNFFPENSKIPKMLSDFSLIRISIRKYKER